MCLGLSLHVIITLESEQTSNLLSPNTEESPSFTSGPRDSKLKMIPACMASHRCVSGRGPWGPATTLGGTRGTSERGRKGSLSPYLLNICFRNVDVSVHLLKVLLGPVSLFAISLKSSFALKAEENGGGGSHEILRSRDSFTYPPPQTKSVPE